MSGAFLGWKSAYSPGRETRDRTSCLAMGFVRPRALPRDVTIELFQRELDVVAVLEVSIRQKQIRFELRRGVVHRLISLPTSGSRIPVPPGQSQPPPCRR